MICVLIQFWKSSPAAVPGLVITLKLINKFIRFLHYFIKIFDFNLCYLKIQIENLAPGFTRFLNKGYSIVANLV